MIIQVHYDDTSIPLSIPDAAVVFDLPAKRLRPIDDSHWLKQGTLPHAIHDFLRSSGRTLIVVNDAFRPTPTAAILDRILPGMDMSHLRFLVATGLHQGAQVSNPQKIFGAWADRIGKRIRVHDAFNEIELADFGSGEDAVRLNDWLAWAEAILIIGSVEPHYFAGFTGGRKIILPGCASFRDVERNHACAVSAESQPLKRSGNPVWEDIFARTQSLNGKDRLAIQVVCDHKQRVYFAASGDWDQTYDRCCEYVATNFGHEVREPFDVVISVVYPPLDRNLYQLQKSYENVAAAVREGGTILLISACAEGIGDDRFLKIAAQIATGKIPASATGERGMMGIHKVHRTIALAKRLRLVLCSKLDSRVLLDLPIRPTADAQNTLDDLIDQYGQNAKIAVVLDAAAQTLSFAGRPQARV